jgi:hypothetical protein
MLSRQVHWVFWLKPNDGIMLYAVSFAAAGSGGGKTTDGVPVELDEEFAAAATCEGSTVTGLDATERVFTAAFMMISCSRSFSSKATEVLRGSEAMACARLLAPLSLGLITFETMDTTPTRITVKKNAGSAILLRRRLRPELRGLLVELRSSLVGRVEAGRGVSSIAVRFRDNAVPSVCARRI